MTAENKVFCRNNFVKTRSSSGNEGTSIAKKLSLLHFVDFYLKFS